MDKIYVANFPLNSSERDLHTLFSKFGNVINVKIMKDFQTGKSKGFAFVTLSSVEDTQMAINQLNGSQFKGKFLKVNYAKQNIRKSGDKVYEINGNQLETRSSKRYMGSRASF